MRAGRLRKRVTFERRSGALDAHGTEDVNIWSELTTVWGAVEPINGREFFSALQIQSDVSTRVICRYSPQLSGVTTKDRISSGGVLYDIRSIISVDSRNRELQFMCTDHEG
jgi:SPP1 family predicted phage head-tail adaptor